MTVVNSIRPTMGAAITNSFNDVKKLVQALIISASISLSITMVI